MKKILIILLCISIVYPQDPLLSQPYYFVQETGKSTIKIGHSANPSNNTGTVILGIKDYSNADSWKNDKVILFPLKHTAMYYDLYNVNKKATIRVSVVFGTPNVAHNAPSINIAEKQPAISADEYTNLSLQFIENANAGMYTDVEILFFIGLFILIFLYSIVDIDNDGY